MRTGAHTTQVLFDALTDSSPPHANGVAYRHEGRRREVRARREVVLCGGAVNSPQLLMLSGIGDPEQLKSHGIDVVAASPEVGKNMRDHLVSLLPVDAEPNTLMGAEALPEVLRYLTRRKGMLTSNIAEAYGFVKTRDDLEFSDIEIIFAPVAYVHEGLQGIPEHGMTMGPILLRPKSRGEITLASADPMDKVVIDPRYLSDPDGEDHAAMTEGLKITQRLFDAPSLRTIRGRRFIVPEGGEKMDLDTRVETALRGASHTLYHPTSTARMGSDTGSVVDPELRVRGVSGLRVADASAMPEIVRGHTNAPSIVIGEKAAELLLAEPAVAKVPAQMTAR